MCCNNHGSCDISYKWLSPPPGNRDDKGVWFIEGPETEDLYSVFERMGYAVATDRLVQAERFRRMARGRLAEILGPGYYLDLDILFRTRGYSNQELQEGFDALDTESKNIIYLTLLNIDRSLFLIDLKCS